MLLQNYKTRVTHVRLNANWMKDNTQLVPKFIGSFGRIINRVLQPMAQKRQVYRKQIEVFRHNSKKNLSSRFLKK